MQKDEDKEWTVVGPSTYYDIIQDERKEYNQDSSKRKEECVF